MQAPRPAHGRYFIETKPPSASNSSPRGSISPRSPMKPLPTAPNAEAKAARAPKDISPIQHSSPRNHSMSGQQAALGQHPSLRQHSASSQPASPRQHPALRQHTNTTQAASSAQHASSRKQSISEQEFKSVQDANPAEHSSLGQNAGLKRRASSKDWNSPTQQEGGNAADTPRDWSQTSIVSPFIEHAISARRVSPVMRMNSMERVALGKLSEPPMPVNEPEKGPPLPVRAASRSRMLGELKPRTDEEQRLRNGGQHRTSPDDLHDDMESNFKEENDPSGTDLPIQSPTAIDPPSPAKSPPVINRVPSHRVTVMSTLTNSDYSGGPTVL